MGSEHNQAAQQTQRQRPAPLGVAGGESLRPLRSCDAARDLSYGRSPDGQQHGDKRDQPRDAHLAADLQVGVMNVQPRAAGSGKKEGIEQVDHPLRHP